MVRIGVQQRNRARQNADVPFPKNDIATLRDNPEFIKAVSAAVDRVNKDLSNIEKIRRFLIAAEPFSIDNEQMTPTLKVRRHVVKAVYGERLEGLYR